MKTMIGVLVAGLIFSVAAAPVAFGQQEGEGAKFTQGDLAQLLVRKLGLSRQMPASPTNFECIVMLSQNGIWPSPTLKPTDANPTPGWDEEAEVTAEDMAVILVRALGLVDKVEGDVADIANWINVLKNVEVEYTPEGGALNVVRPLLDQVPIARALFQLTPDPLTKRYIPESVITEVLGLIFDSLPGPISEEGAKPKPVTPKFPTK